MRLLEGEAFPLSTKERCPYLVFCEVTEDPGAEHAKARRRWGLEQVHAGATAAVARLSKLQVGRRVRNAKTSLPAEIRPAAELGGSSGGLSDGGAGGGTGGEGGGSGGGGGGGAGGGGGGGGGPLASAACSGALGLHEVTHEITHEISPALEEGGHQADSPATPPPLQQRPGSDPELSRRAGSSEGDINLDAALDGGEGTAMTPLPHCAPLPPTPPPFALGGGVGGGVGDSGGSGGGGGSAAARPEAGAGAGAGAESELEVEAGSEAETGSEASPAVRAELPGATISGTISGGGESDEARADLRWRERISEDETDDALAPPAMEVADGERSAEDAEHAATHSTAADYSCDDGFGELWEDRVARLRAASPVGANGGWRLAAFIAKARRRAAATLAPTLTLTPSLPLTRIPNPNPKPQPPPPPKIQTQTPTPNPKPQTQPRPQRRRTMSCCRSSSRRSWSPTSTGAA